MNHFPPEILQMSVLIDGILNKVEVILINEKLICFHLITVFNSFSFCEKIKTKIWVLHTFIGQNTLHLC